MSGSSVAAPADHVAPWKWGVVWLMFLATVINYMDRMTVNFTSEFIMREFNLDERGYARIETAFALTFGPAQLFAGFLVARYRLSWLYAAALLVWSLAGFMTGLATTIGGLIACRVLLGLGESFNWPCAVGTVGRIIPRSKQPLANAIFHGGTSIGAIITPLLVLAMIDEKVGNWRPVFLIVGAVGAIWVFFWLGFVRGERAAQVDRIASSPSNPHPTLPFMSLFRSRKIWIALAAGICVNVCWHFLRVFLVRHLKKDLNYEFTTQQKFLAIYFLAADLGSVALGYLTRRLTDGGMSIERVRKIMAFVTAGLCLFMVPAMKETDPLRLQIVMCIVGVGALAGFSIYFALVQDVAPGRASEIIGLSGTVSWLTVAYVTEQTGYWADRLGTYEPIFFVVSVVPLIGAILGLFWPRAGNVET